MSLSNSNTPSSARANQPAIWSFRRADNRLVPGLREDQPLEGPERHAAGSERPEPLCGKIFCDGTVVKSYATIGGKSEQRAFKQRFPLIRSPVRQDECRVKSGLVIRDVSRGTVPDRHAPRELHRQRESAGPFDRFVDGEFGGLRPVVPRLQLRADIRRYLLSMSPDTLVLMPIGAQLDQILGTPREFLRVSSLQVFQHGLGVVYVLIPREFDYLRV